MLTDLRFLQIEDVAVEYFENVVRQDKINISMNVPLQPETLSKYIEGWRRKIWDHGFMAHLRGTNYFKKSDNFMTYEGSKQAVRRVLFRYASLTF
jgi:hypothetical protein